MVILSLKMIVTKQIMIINGKILSFSEVNEIREKPCYLYPFQLPEKKNH